MREPTPFIFVDLMFFYKQASTVYIILVAGLGERGFALIC